MHGNRTWLMAMSVVLGTASSWVVKADDQRPAVGPAYYIADFEVTDREAIKPYSENVEATFKPFGGRFIVRGADAVPNRRGAWSSSSSIAWRRRRLGTIHRRMPGCDPFGRKRATPTSTSCRGCPDDGTQPTRRF